MEEMEAGMEKDAPPQKAEEDVNAEQEEAEEEERRRKAFAADPRYHLGTWYEELKNMTFATEQIPLSRAQVCALGPFIHETYVVGRRRR